MMQANQAVSTKHRDRHLVLVALLFGLTSGLSAHPEKEVIISMYFKLFFLASLIAIPARYLFAYKSINKKFKIAGLILALETCMSTFLLWFFLTVPLLIPSSAINEIGFIVLIFCITGAINFFVLKATGTSLSRIALLAFALLFPISIIIAYYTIVWIRIPDPVLAFPF